MLSPVDTYATHFQNSETKKYDSPGVWDADISLDDIKYLYTKTDEDMYKIESDCVYVRSYAIIPDETNLGNFTIGKSDDYNVKISKNEYDEIVVDVIY